MNPLLPFLAWLRRRQAARIHIQMMKRDAVLGEQIQLHKAKHWPWKYLEGERRACKRAMLEAEVALRASIGRSA